MKKYIDSLKILNKNGLYTIRGNINIDSLTISIILGVIISSSLFLIYKHINKTDN